MLQTWLHFAGVEIGNNTRVAAYMRDSGSAPLLRNDGCVCPTIPDALGDLPYLAPEIDPAPWYDPSDPRSAEFAGFWIEEIDGLHDSVIERTVTQRTTDGAVKSCARYKDRVLTVTGWLFAKSVCGADYGKFWLNSVLLGSRCSDCRGDDICLFACCPTNRCDGEGESESGEGEDGPCYDTDVQLRTLRGAALISGPDPVATAPGLESDLCVDGARPIYRITFQISAEPYYWRQPITIAEHLPWPMPTGDEVCHIQWNTDGDCDPDNPDCVPGANVPLAGCAPDELCPPPPRPPRVPAATASCVCLPLTAVRQCIDVPADLVPSWMDAALRITVHSGETELRNLAIRVWENPDGLTPEQLDLCHTEGVYYVTHIPAESTLTIDGMAEKSVIRCPGYVVTGADTKVYGPGAGPLEHIALTCGTQYTICADVDAEFIDPLAHLSVELIPREA